VQQDPTACQAPAQDDAILLASALNAPRTTLRFPPLLEARFRAQEQTERLHYQRNMGLFVVAVFLSCLGVDRELVPDVWHLALLLRGGAAILGLLMLGALWLPTRKPDWAGDVVMTIFALVAGAVLTILFAATQSADRGVYFDGLVVVVMAANICLQPRFPFVAAGCAGVLGMAALTLRHSGEAAPVLHSQLANLSIAIAMTLIITHRLEWQRRRAYLLGARDRLREAELMHSNAALLDLSGLDGLTGLANRRSVDRHLQNAWRRCEAAGEPIAVIMMDVDWFKPFNDTYGHPAGDECLLSIARVLQHSVRDPGDLAGRYGGEEFILILQGAGRDDAMVVAERVRGAVEALNIEHSASPCAGIVTASLGLGCAMPGKGGTLDALLQAADMALYASKQAGRARVSFAPEAPTGQPRPDEIRQEEAVPTIRDTRDLSFAPAWPSGSPA
jgi:diguanylate cyclase (GGDEF)-like protein